MADSQKSLDLSSFPPIFVLSTHIATEDLHELEDELIQSHATITYDLGEAGIVLGRVSTKRRAQLELRTRKVFTVEVDKDVYEKEQGWNRFAMIEHEQRVKAEIVPHDIVPAKASGYVSDSSTLSDASSARLGDDQKGAQVRGEANGSSTESEEEPVQALIESRLKRKRGEETPLSSPPPLAPTEASWADTIEGVDSDPTLVWVVKVEWLEDSLAGGIAKSLEPYVVYIGQRVGNQAGNNLSRAPTSNKPSQGTTLSKQDVVAVPRRSSILGRAEADAGISSQNREFMNNAAAPYGARRFRDQGSRTTLTRGDQQHHNTHLLQQSTTDYEGVEDTAVPPPPDWVKKRVKYACERITPANPPNAAFIAEMQKIKLARLLTADEIGVRAYATSIAAIAAYPYQFSAGREVLSLPGCDVKIANLWVEWKNTARIKAAVDAEDDETLKILRDFYEIWGVGATTAREFYYDRGWRDRDDIVEYGWSTLSRVQQIGVKYYDEFLEGMERNEVESIAAVVQQHCIKVRDEGIELLVVGGYRRGKQRSGDVDMIVSHRQLDATANLITDIVSSLETDGWITHTLTLALTSTERQQATLPFKSSGSTHGAGFDTLDKALVVWQDPNFDKTKHKKNPNPHRRVDIIVSPWRTVGCAVAGWTSGTTFQRDLRRYAKAVKNWKFDSSGIRDRSTGDVVKLEGPYGVEGSMVDAERAVFEGMGLEYREPRERCTG